MPGNKRQYCYLTKGFLHHPCGAGPFFLLHTFETTWFSVKFSQKCFLKSKYLAFYESLRV